MNSGTQYIKVKCLFKNCCFSSRSFPLHAPSPPTDIAVIRINLVCLDFPRQWICFEYRYVSTFLSIIKWNQHSFWHPRIQAFFFWDGSIRIIFCIVRLGYSSFVHRQQSPSESQSGQLHTLFPANRAESFRIHLGSDETQWYIQKEHSRDQIAYIITGQVSTPLDSMM